MKSTRLLVCLVVVLLLLASSAYARGSQEGGAEGEPITLTFANFIVGDSPGGRVYEARYALFEEMYGDRYNLKVDEIPGGEEYNEKLTLQISTGKMPDLYISENDTMGKEAYEAGLAIDMEPYADQIPNFDKYYPRKNIEKVENQFGEWVIFDPYAPRLSGYYYNKEMFEQVGYDEPPKTFDEFFDLCEKLKAAGITPVGMMTGENGWTMHFWYEALMAAHSEEGLQYAMNPQTTDFTSEPFRYASEKVKLIITEYANSDALGASYEMVASQMFNGDLAMIGNGPWMAASYRNPNKTEPGFEEKIGYAPMPGNFVYGFSDTIGHGAMTAPNGEQKQLGAMLFWGTEIQPQIMEKAAIELGWFVDAYDYPEDVIAQQPIIAEMHSRIQSWDSTALPWFYDVWTNAVMADGMTRNMDLYVQDEITLDEYLANVAEFAEAVGKE